MINCVDMEKGKGCKYFDCFYGRCSLATVRAFLTRKIGISDEVICSKFEAIDKRCEVCNVSIKGNHLCEACYSLAYGDIAAKVRIDNMKGLLARARANL